MKTKQEFEQWLRQWLIKATQMPPDAPGRDLFAEGWLDSLATVQLILEIEAALQISLTDSELGDKRMSSITGLAEMLFERQSTTTLRAPSE